LIGVSRTLQTLALRAEVVHWQANTLLRRGALLLRHLDRFIHQVEERIQPEADFDAVARERRISKSLGGRTVSQTQLTLF